MVDGLEKQPPFMMRMIELMLIITFLPLMLGIFGNIVLALISRAEVYHASGWVESNDRWQLATFGQNTVTFFGGQQVRYGDNPNNLSVDVSSFCNITIRDDTLINSTCIHKNMPTLIIQNEKFEQPT